MRLRIRIIAAFALCTAVPLLAGIGAIIFGAQSLLYGSASDHLRSATAATVGALEERMALDLANLKAWSTMPVMQDVLIGDDGGDIARVLAAFQRQHRDFAAFSVTDSRGTVVATTIKGEKGVDLSLDEGVRAAASGRVYQSAWGIRSMSTAESIWFTVPIIAAYDRQTVVGTLTGVLDFVAAARAVADRSVLAASGEPGSHVFVLERRADGRIIFTSRTDANLLQALNGIDDKRAETDAEISWGENKFFVSAAASKGKGLIRDPGFLARGVAPAGGIFETANVLAIIFGVVASLAAAGAMYFAWLRTTPLVQLADAAMRYARGDTTAAAPAVAPQDAFADLARALEVFRQTRIVRDKIAAREQELHRANQEAESAARAKSEHLASLSREIRTQLTTIIGMSELINKESLAAAGATPNAANAQYVGYAKDIGRSGVQLLAVINDLFDLSEAEAGHLKVDEAEMDLALLARDGVDMMRDAATKAKVTLMCDAGDQSIWVRADAHKMKQVLFNLLSNAVKFTPEHGLVRVGVRVLSGDRPAVTVQDNGIGMHANLPPVAMIPFSASGEASTHGRHGAGFGLPLARQLIELHDGAIEIESEIGKGTTVTVVLPTERLVSRSDGAARYVA
jgi:signal transduction histidine kinase